MLSHDPLIALTLIPRVRFDKVCVNNISIDRFIQNYRPRAKIRNQFDGQRVDPSVERISKLFELLRAAETQYGSVMKAFGVFLFTDPNATLQAYENTSSNIDEIKQVYHRYIRLSNKGSQIHVDDTLLDYLKRISGYLTDGYQNQRTSHVGQVR
jgi:hypothetical protein